MKMINWKRLIGVVMMATSVSGYALEKPYIWENLTSDDFKTAVSNSQGVVVVPIGCVEMHNHHLPIGTDYLAANDIVRTALKEEPALMFTFGLFGAVRESCHQPGAISLSSNTLKSMMEELCDEFARNGLTDIIFWNDHGGNVEFMREFVRSRLEKPHPYRVYFRNDGFLGSQYKELHKKFTIPNSTAPNQAYGDPTGATRELGEWQFNTSVSNLVSAIRLIKAHQPLAARLQREFYQALTK